MPKKIAEYLNLPDPTKYTGPCFRRTSATILIDAGGDLMALKRHGGWKSSVIAEGYVDNSITNKTETSNKILQSVSNNIASPSTFIPIDYTDNAVVNKILEKSGAPIVIKNCQNVTVNYNIN